MINLKENWAVSTTDFEEFKELLKEVSDATGSVVVAPEDVLIDVISGEKNENKLPGVWLGKETLLSECLKKAGISLPPRTCLRLPETGSEFSGLLKEAEEETGALFRIGTTTYFLSPTFISRLGGDVGLTGAFLEASPVTAGLRKADALNALMSAWAWSGGRRTLVYREVEDGGKKMKKFFGIGSEKFAPIPQTILLEVFDSIVSKGLLGKPEFIRGEMTHIFTDMYVSFPDKGTEIRECYPDFPPDFKPVVRFTTSDVAQSAVRISAGWMIGNTFIQIGEEVSRRHIGRPNPEEIVRKSEELFLNFTKIPEALCELMLTSATPEGLDFSKSDASEKNAEAIYEIVDRLSVKMRLENLITKKATEEAVGKIKERLNPFREVSMYEIYLEFIEIPSAVKLTRSQTDALSKALGRLAVELTRK